MIENVESFYAELRFGPFPEFKTLANGEIDVVETSIAENVATHGAKLADPIRDQNRIAYHIAIVSPNGGISKGGCCGRTDLSSGSKAGRRDSGACAGPAPARTEARNPVGTDGLKVRRVAEEIPAVSRFARSAEAIVLIIDIPWLSRLHGDDGVELPALQQLAPGLFLGERISHGKSEAVAKVFVAAGMFQERMRAVLRKERDPIRGQVIQGV